MLLLTEYRRDDDTASDGKSSEESQHCKHDEGRRKSTTQPKTHSWYMWHQQHWLTPIPV